MDRAMTLIFMAAVTCYLLARILAGPATAVEALVYGATAAFELEYPVASWRSLWGRA